MNFQVEQLRLDGNKFFEQGNYNMAEQCYSKALEFQPDDAKLYSNRSSAYLKQKMLDAAEQDAERAIQIDPLFGKGYIRSGAVCVERKEFDRAIKIVKKGYKTTNDPELSLYGARVLAQHCTTAPLTPKRTVPVGYSLLKDEIFAMSHPSYLSSVKRESSIVLHNAPSIRALQSSPDKYMTIMLVRLPNFATIKEFWEGLSASLKKSDPDTESLPTQLFDYDGFHMAGVSRGEQGAHRFSYQIASQSPKHGCIYLVDFQCPIEQIFKFSVDLQTMRNTLTLRPEGRLSEASLKAPATPPTSWLDSIAMWMSKPENQTIVSVIPMLLLAPLVLWVVQMGQSINSPN